MVPSHDGQEIPLNIYFKKDGFKLNRRNRVVMEGYGAYGISMSQGFSITNLSAMERGYVIAQAQVRGGGERGVLWHQQGKLLNKMNSFHDFNSCAEFLIANRITHPTLLAAKGSSAGGLLVAQSMNMRPDLYRAVILNVPFLDVLGSLLDETLPLTLTDHLEFGNPIDDEEIYKLIASYSPYENLSSQEYPAILMKVQMQDPRVPFFSTLKYVAKLRELAAIPSRQANFGQSNIVVRIKKEGGHFGSVDNQENLNEEIEEFAWLDFLMLEALKDLGQGDETAKKTKK